MKFGPLEIGIVVVVMLIIFAVTRMRQLGKNDASAGKPPRRRTARNNEKIKQLRRSRIQILGSIFILGSILTLLSSLNLLKWIPLGFMWASIIAAIGLVTIFIARRRL